MQVVHPGVHIPGSELLISPDNPTDSPTSVHVDAEITQLSSAIHSRSTSQLGHLEMPLENLNSNPIIFIQSCKLGLLASHLFHFQQDQGNFAS